MSELITALNLDIVVKRNREIAKEVSSQALKLQTNSMIMKASSIPQLALMILQEYGLIQMPVEDKYLSGAIYVKDGKHIPVINTALPRANQYFAAWHEVYHLIFDEVSFDHFIGADNTLEERKAEFFAASMLLNGIERYFTELPEQDLLSKVFCCMSAYQAPYKAVLVSLYEYASLSKNDLMKDRIKDIFDLRIDDLPGRFRNLGLDDSLVMPSYVVNTSFLREQIRRTEAENPGIEFHKDNELFLENIMKEIHVIMRNGR